MGAIMLLILTMFVCLFSCGTYMLVADYLGLPTMRTSLVVLSSGKLQRKKRMDTLILGLSIRLSRFIKLDAYRKKKLSATLKSAGLSFTPEVYIGRAWVKAGLILLGIIPAIFIFPILSFGVLLLSVMVYFKESRFAEEALKKRRSAIESEMFRFVMTLEQELKTNRDVLRILENYRKNSGEALKNELDITVADMKSGSLEAALSRLETRVGSAMLSDVVRGLLGVLRGDDGRVYFQMLSHDFKLMEIQKLKLIAMKRPSKVRKYSFLMLACFILMYLSVMAVEIMKTFSNMF